MGQPSENNPIIFSGWSKKLKRIEAWDLISERRYFVTKKMQ